MKKNCNQCKKEFEAKEELDMFCSQECKQEALADLDSDSDECLSCQWTKKHMHFSLKRIEEKTQLPTL